MQHYNSRQGNSESLAMALLKAGVTPHMVVKAVPMSLYQVGQLQREVQEKYAFAR